MLKEAYDRFLKGNFQILHDAIFNRLKNNDILNIMKELFKPDCILALLRHIIQNEQDKAFIKKALAKSVQQALQEKKIKVEDNDQCLICLNNYSELKKDNNLLIPLSCCAGKICSNCFLEADLSTSQCPYCRKDNATTVIDI